MSYNGALNAEEQVGAEEWIAAMIYDLRGHADGPCEADTICEESAGELGRLILYKILARFRPDLIAVEIPDPVEGCLFPDSHCPEHDPDWRFGVRLPGRDWEDLTEAEIVRAMNETGAASFTHTSQWDFWCEDIHDLGRCDDGGDDDDD